MPTGMYLALLISLSNQQSDYNTIASQWLK